jgi:hypothetical protein
MPSSGRIGRFGSVLIAVLILPACNSLNPLCGSARPAPVLTSISPTSEVLGQLPPTFVLTLNGSHFVSSSVVIFDGTTLATTVVSSTQLTATISSAMFTAAASFDVVVQTPAGNTQLVGCTSGGTSSPQVFTVN